MENKFKYYEVHVHTGSSNTSITTDSGYSARFIAKCLIDLYEQGCRVEILELVREERIDL